MLRWSLPVATRSGGYRGTSSDQHLVLLRRLEFQSAPLARRENLRVQEIPSTLKNGGRWLSSSELQGLVHVSPVSCAYAVNVPVCRVV
jgi:hypothetical protein